MGPKSELRQHDITNSSPKVAGHPVDNQKSLLAKTLKEAVTAAKGVGFKVPVTECAREALSNLKSLQQVIQLVDLATCSPGTLHGLKKLNADLEAIVLLLIDDGCAEPASSPVAPIPLSIDVERHPTHTEISIQTARKATDIGGGDCE
jgi:hypothetical protein